MKVNYRNEKKREDINYVSKGMLKLIMRSLDF